MITSQILINILIYSTIPTLVALYVTERIKGNIKNSFDKQIEVVKKEHAIEISKFTKLHEKRLEVLADTYSYITRTIRLLHIYVSPLNSSNNLELNSNDDVFDVNYVQKVGRQFQVLYDEFNVYFNENIIYFDEDTEKLLYDYFKSMADVFIISNSSNALLKMKTIQDIENKKTINLMFESLNKRVLPLKKQIEIKFRILLG